MAGQKISLPPSCPFHEVLISAVKSPPGRIFFLSACVRSAGFLGIGIISPLMATALHAVQSFRHATRVHGERVWYPLCMNMKTEMYLVRFYRHAVLLRYLRKMPNEDTGLILTVLRHNKIRLSRTIFPHIVSLS
jgi:hypothetical protein